MVIFTIKGFSGGEAEERDILLRAWSGLRDAQGKIWRFRIWRVCSAICITV
jgi:hypothetical protein